MLPLLILLTFHWLGDFVCQNDWMALNKSKRLFPLTVHVLVYTAVMFLGLLVLDPAADMLTGLLLISGGHFITDFFTSRLNTYLISTYESKHWFFVGVGFDQLIHVWNLALVVLVLGV